MDHSKQLLLKTLRKVAEDHGYKDDVIIKNISTNGANYSSHLFQITLRSQGKPDLKLFSKVAALSKELRDSIPIQLFNAEQIFYSELNPAHEKLLKAYNIPQEHRFRSPKFYGICTKSFEEVVIMEDLGQLGYGMFDRHMPIDFEYAKAAVTQLAYFHALSRVYALQNPEGFQRIVQSVQCNIQGIGVMAAHHETFTKNALEVVEEEYKDRFEKFARGESGPEHMERLYQPIDTTFLVHGDFRASNLMHKIENGHYNICTVDYQTILPGSPAGDLIYFLFMGTDEEFRRQHFKEIVEYYYTQLSIQLKRFELDPEVVYPKKEWDQEFKNKLPFGLSFAILILPIVLVEDDDAPDTNKMTDLSNLAVKPGSLYPERLNGIIRDFIRWGII